MDINKDINNRPTENNMQAQRTREGDICEYVRLITIAEKFRESSPFYGELSGDRLLEAARTLRITGINLHHCIPLFRVYERGGVQEVFTPTDLPQRRASGTE